VCNTRAARSGEKDSTGKREVDAGDISSKKHMPRGGARVIPCKRSIFKKRLPQKEKSTCVNRSAQAHGPVTCVVPALCGFQQLPDVLLVIQKE